HQGASKHARDDAHAHLIRPETQDTRVMLQRSVTAVGEQFRRAFVTTAWAAASSASRCPRLARRVATGELSGSARGPLGTTALAWLGTAILVFFARDLTRENA